ncbi:carbohydrate kinase family protein [Acidaminobacter sp. JC074]|uniref:carbohydrate kinase family protein n=1 Tax=Acidaminobacter sp. JC074 TaxID=2530199 RepID=UPI001F10A847|nr:carbohydrate kinase family protein [Acidaminobacter sp. JC074]MCH4888276.1 carbohydrate kinase family protein [Acidaminobacter sp. JC074]
MKALILGTAGLQINIPIDSFPFEYKSIVFMDDKVSMDVAGVGYSHCRILGKLEDEITFLTGIGNDPYACVIEKAIEDSGASLMIDRKDKASLVSVILYDNEGRRTILREGRMDYKYKMKPSAYEKLEDDYDVALFSMAGFSKDLLPIIKEKGIPIACDIQDVHNLDNEYGKDFMAYADIIFFSNDNYEDDLDSLLMTIYKKYKYSIIGVGLGSKGCALCVDGKISYYGAVKTEVVNTVGAGDALFASFVHCYFNGDSPDVAIKKAQVFAAEKIKYTTASKGFMNKTELETRYKTSF